jgi:hypothetical protein
MKIALLALMILVAGSAFAQQDERPPSGQAVTFFDVLDLPARIDEPRLKKTPNDYILTCAIANRSGQALIGLRLNLMFVDSTNGRITHAIWNEATDIPAYAIKTFELEPRIKNELKDSTIYLGIDEVIGRETVWRTIDSDKLLGDYARGRHGMVPKVLAVQNMFDREPAGARVIP